MTQYGGDRFDWIDLSTGINPQAYPLPVFHQHSWAALPDAHAMNDVLKAARQAWRIPERAGIVAAAGASALIAQIPTLVPAGSVHIPAPTYNEHAAAFRLHGWTETTAPQADAAVVVHPNNPDGRRWSVAALPRQTRLTVIDESFCDASPQDTLIDLAARPGHLVLKSFGKFWGLAGLRLGFAIGDPALVARLQDRLGPWAVAGPALAVAAKALRDTGWADDTRRRLAQDSARLDRAMADAGAQVLGGTTLFRLYKVDDAAHWQARLARHHIWSRVFPYDPTWLRLGMPHALHWPRLTAALA